MKRRADLTFQHNLGRGRHGWLRLTPAYSVKIVREILEREPEVSRLLDPFSGSGTTGLVAAERGLHCDLLDINPFLVWLAEAKTRQYSPEQITEAKQAARTALAGAKQLDGNGLWRPPIKNIERWWPETSLDTLARLCHAIGALEPLDSSVRDLLLVGFCRCVIAWSNAAFNHQSMSFKASPQPSLFDADEQAIRYAAFSRWVGEVIDSAAEPPPGTVTVRQADARAVPEPTTARYECVITSPPYPNRMSYIRELRPYMYWLGYLNEAREAGEMDWKAIGGTWGIATSRVAKWEPNGITVPHDGFGKTIEEIAATPGVANARLLANYVHRYFADITGHIRSLYPQVDSGGRVHYIVGNSKFYDTMVQVEAIYGSILRDAGFGRVCVERIRKRNSKKELFEFDVTAVKL